MRIFFWSHNWAIFLRKCARRGRYSQWRLLSDDCIATDRVTQDADVGKKKSHLFRLSSFWSWRVCKQAKLLHLRHRKTRTHTLKSRLVRIYAIFFFVNEQGNAVTVNGDRYWTILNEFLFTKIEEEDIVNVWFQQDSATCHTAEPKLDVLRPVFEDLIINRRANIIWPSRSYDLTPLYNYL